MSYIAKILGVDYEVQVSRQEDDPILNECNGYCDPSIKYIGILDLNSVDHEKDILALKDQSKPQNKLFRHEYIHAFFYESGLQDYYEDEQLVDWLAIQFPKMMKMFVEMGVEK